MGDRRGANGWVKGKSANPGGKTKAEVAARRMAAELIDQETDGGREILRFAINVMRGQVEDCDDSKSRRWAADFLADRRWGKAPLIVEVGPAASEVEIPDVKGLTLEELRAAAAGDDVDPPGDVH